MSNDNQPSDDRIYLFDKPENVKRVIYGLFALCGLLVVLDFVIHRHAIHELEKIPGFYALYGFGAYVLLVLIAKVYRLLLMRPEDYYSARENDSAGSKQSDIAGE